jgi:hypothetical protein
MATSRSPRSLGSPKTGAGAGTVSEAETAIEKGIDVARRQNANEP